MINICGGGRKGRAYKGGLYVHEGEPGLVNEGIVLARKEKCRRWQPLMIINLFRPPTNRRLRTGSGLEGVSIHSSRHTNAPLLAPVNNPDLSCHILTSSPSIQIGSLPCACVHSTAFFSETTMFAGILRRRPGHDLLFPSLHPPSSAATKLSVYPRSIDPDLFLPFYLRWPIIQNPRCFIYRVSHSQPFSYSPLFARIRETLYNCRWPHQNTHMLMRNVLPLPSLHPMRYIKRVHAAK